jgi:dihydrofolate reductase
MRKIVSGLFISLDGVVERPDQWHFPYFNDEMGEAVGAMTQNCDANLFGRKTFEEFASYWPQHADDVPFASYINGINKYVASNTLTSTDWNNSEIISGDVMAEVAKLKEQPGKDIGMTGSGTLVRGLLEAGLLDELHLLLHPIAVVNGKRLFEPGGESIPL